MAAMAIRPYVYKDAIPFLLSLTQDIYLLAQLDGVGISTTTFWYDPREHAWLAPGLLENQAILLRIISMYFSLSKSHFALFISPLFLKSKHIFLFLRPFPHTKNQPPVFSVPPQLRQLPLSK